MFGLLNKRWVRSFIFGKIGLIILAIIFTVFARGTWGVYEKARFAKENREQSEQNLRELEERERALEEELVRLNTSRGLEEEIRHKFDVGRDGEQLVVLVDAPEPEVVTDVREPNVWERMVRFFGFDE